MSYVPIESFVNVPGIVHSFMDFKEFYRGRSEASPEDFPPQLTVYHWYVAYLGWTLVTRAAITNADGHLDTAVGVPNHLKPTCDFQASRGALVMIGTVALVLDLTGFDQAGMEFLRRAQDMDYDTGQLYMLALDYVKSITSIDAPAVPS